MKRGLLISFVLIIFMIFCGCSMHKTDNKDTINIETNSTKKPTAVYYGNTLDAIDGNVDFANLTDSIQKQNLLVKYEKSYYLYSNNKLIGNAIGKIEESGLDSYWHVVFPSEFENYEVAITQSYNPYPREVININSNFQKDFSNIIAEVNNKFSVNSKIKELSCIDLDGDGQNECLAFFVDENNNFFANCLLDSKNMIISFLTVFKEKCENFSETIEEFSLLNGCEIIDINNDNVMEIIAQIPTYEGLFFRVFTYNNGNFDGDYINKGSFEP